METYLIIGLGNPGREYAETRHNAGFMVIDRLGKNLGWGCNKVQNKALVGIGKVDGNRVILSKPQTYMNLSGQAVSGLMRFYKVPTSNLLVIHDDLDLPLGTLRLRPGGGPGGQKGVASIIEQLGTEQFGRIRFGIDRPPGRMDPKDYVLQPFRKEDAELVIMTLDRAQEAAQSFIREGLERAMNRYNGPI
ncbi:MAG: aminoacyl-tRNA hydrolase [Anaerolineae bacterium]|nr:aminoacyl-tRNA hydrolase [Anaerolineae bacterium]